MLGAGDGRALVRHDAREVVIRSKDTATYTGSVDFAGRVFRGTCASARCSARISSGKAAIIVDISPSQACLRPSWVSRVSRTRSRPIPK